MKIKVFTTILFVQLQLCFTNVEHQVHQHQDEDGPRLQPLNYRLPRLPTLSPTLLGPGVINITAEVHTAVTLPCRVVNLGSGSVTWLRWPELTILSSGSTVFTSSTRVSLVQPSPGSPDYNLRLSPVLPGDQGQYQCHVNTGYDTPVIVNLSVSVTWRPEDEAPSMSSSSWNDFITRISCRLRSLNSRPCRQLLFLHDKLAFKQHLWKYRHVTLS